MRVYNNIFPARGHCLLSIIVLFVAFVSTATAQENAEDAVEMVNCTEGLVVPLWMPQSNLSTGDRVARAIVYFVVMFWLFIGVSIVADRFMGSIEMITSQEKEVKIKKANGDKQIIVVQVWNETVANLTLMALGSSAPEILLSVIEMFAKKFEAGDLGPGTIVGSAAFNLFVIIGICVDVIPAGEVRYIKHLRVFFVTAFFSIFAYVWLYLILAQISYGVVEFWEAFLTFLFFPITVLWAYIADRKLLVYKYMSKEYRISKRGVIVEVEGGDLELGSTKKDVVLYDENDETVREFEEHRKEYMSVIRELRQKYPDISMESLESMAREEIINRGPKSRAFYRIQATRKLTGGGNVMKKVREETKQELKLDEEEEKKEEGVVRVYFDPGHYTVMESVGTFDVTIARHGGDLSNVVLVDYKTEDGSANAGSDYIKTEGTMTFLPGETSKSFSIEVIDDDVFEEDEHFYVKLSNIRLGTPDGITNASNGTSALPQKPNKLELSAPFVATVMILDDDHGGIFNVDEKDVEVVESIGIYEVKIMRISGARGRVVVPYTTKDGTGKAGKDYEHVEGEVTFENNETEKFVEVQILEEDSYEKDVLFYFDIGEPTAQGGFEFEDKGQSDMTEEQKIALLGKPKLGTVTRTQIRVKENREYKNMVDKLVKKANASIVLGTSSWKEQFVEALSVNAGEEEEDEEGEGDGEKEEKLPSCGDYVMHFITVFWKLLFALIPPTDHFNGYPTFVVSICGIGLLTAVIGDLASHLGCTIGLKDTITAIAFVALGTSVPDTFASKVAALQDPYADASVGNVTGSNAVNVFLGIGIAWTMAAVYHNANGKDFLVQPGNLAFSVTLFCVEAFVAITIMMIRRHPKIGGELGGPDPWKKITSYFLISLWLFYVFMSTLEAYHFI